MSRLLRVALSKAGHIEQPYSLAEILDKIEQHGIGSLTPDEKKFLEDFDKS